MAFKFKDISIDNITKFSHIQLDFVSGINVIIGKNGTGKTHLLKILYSIARAKSSKDDNNSTFKEKLNSRIKGIFKLDKIEKLIRDFKKDTDFTINYHLENDSLDYFIQYISAKNIIEFDSNSENQYKIDVVFFPTQEMITAYSEFIPFYEKYDVKYDETLYILAKALSEPKLKTRTEFQNRILAIVEKHLEGKLVKDGTQFYVENHYGRIEASMLAEGMKKLATLQYLIENGTITENSILIWDEPEIYFNPKLITILSGILNELANSGIQIFLATHDYLLSHQLSLMDEYRTTMEDEITSMKFFCLEDKNGEGVIVHSGRNLTEIQNNPILEEFANHYDLERELFQRSMKDE